MEMESLVMGHVAGSLSQNHLINGDIWTYIPITLYVVIGNTTFHIIGHILSKPSPEDHTGSGL